MFNLGQDAEVMEEAISKFMDSMEAQEHIGFKELCAYYQEKSRNDTLSHSSLAVSNRTACCHLPVHRVERGGRTASFSQ